MLQCAICHEKFSEKEQHLCAFARGSNICQDSGAEIDDKPRGRYTWEAYRELILSTKGYNPDFTEKKTWNELYNEVERLSAELENLKNILAALKCGGCWCDMGIGNPMVSDHSQVCKSARKALSENEG